MGITFWGLSVFSQHSFPAPSPKVHNHFIKVFKNKCVFNKSESKKNMNSNVESALGNSETSLSMLRVLADNSFDSILITDTTVQGKIIYANKSFKNLTGHDPADVIGKTPRILQGVGTDKTVISRLATALKSGKKFQGKTINYKKDGTPFIMYWRVVPIRVGRKIEAWVAIQREGSFI